MSNSRLHWPRNSLTYYNRTDKGKNKAKKLHSKWFSLWKRFYDLQTQILGIFRSLCGIVNFFLWPKTRAAARSRQSRKNNHHKSLQGTFTALLYNFKTRLVNLPPVRVYRSPQRKKYCRGPILAYWPRELPTHEFLLKRKKNCKQQPPVKESVQFWSYFEQADVKRNRTKTWEVAGEQRTASRYISRRRRWSAASFFCLSKNAQQSVDSPARWGKFLHSPIANITDAPQDAAAAAADPPAAAAAACCFTWPSAFPRGSHREETAPILARDKCKGWEVVDASQSEVSGCA